MVQKDIDIQSDLELEIEIQKLNDLLAQRRNAQNLGSKDLEKSEPKRSIENLNKERLTDQQTIKKGVVIDVEDQNTDGNYQKF